MNTIRSRSLWGVAPLARGAWLMLAALPGVALASANWHLAQSLNPGDGIAPVGGEIIVTNTLHQDSGTSGTIGYEEAIGGSGTLTRMPVPACAVPIGNSVVQTASNRLTVSAVHTGVGTGSSCMFQHKVSATAAGSFLTTFPTLLGNPVPAPTGQTYKFFERPKVAISTPSAFVAGGSASVTVTLSNTNTVARFDSTNLTVTLGSGLAVATGGGSTTCGGTVTANAGASTVVLGGGAQIPPSGNCNVTFPVTASKAGGYPISVTASNLTASLNTAPPSGPWAATAFSPSGTATAYAVAYDQQVTAFSTATRDRFLGDYEMTFFMNFRHLVSASPIWTGNAMVRFSPLFETAGPSSNDFDGPLFSDPLFPSPTAWRSFPGDSFPLNVQCNGGAASCDMFDGAVGYTGDLTGDFFVSFSNPTANPPSNGNTALGKCSTSGGTIFVANDKELGWGNVNCTFPAGPGSNTYDASGTFLLKRPTGFSPTTPTTPPPATRQPPAGFTQIPLPSQTFLVIGDGTIPDAGLDVFEQRTPGSPRRSLIVDLKVEDAAQRARNAFAASAYNVYVVALVPGGRAQTVATYTAYAKPPSGAWAALSGPIPAFLQNVAVSSQDQRIRLEIIRDTDVNNLVGTEFYVGYGTSDSEMIQSKRYRGIYYIGF